MIKQVLLTLKKIVILLRNKLSKGSMKINESTTTPKHVELSRYEISELCRKNFTEYVELLQKMPDDVLIQY